MAKFAEYGFNKSHSAAYAVLTYQTAYLKTHYPAEFMAALMTTEMDNTDKITKYIGDARAHNMLVLAPSVNSSQKKFSVERVDRIRRQSDLDLKRLKALVESPSIRFWKVARTTARSKMFWTSVVVSPPAR